MSEERGYALELDEGEIERYRLMAGQARAAEADLWELAGMATAEDVAGWDRAFQQVAAAPDPSTLFIPRFYAVGRRPG